MARADRCLREISFTVGRPAAELMPDAVASVPQDAAVEEILIQGMADCAFEENGVLHIVDYKTDRVHTAAELCDRYAPQLEIYAYALSRSLGLPIGSCLLYSFALDEVIPVPLK